MAYRGLGGLNSVQHRSETIRFLSATDVLSLLAIILFMLHAVDESHDVDDG